jgi:hypothetical protein
LTFPLSLSFWFTSSTSVAGATVAALNIESSGHRRAPRGGEIVQPTTGKSSGWARWCPPSPRMSRTLLDVASATNSHRVTEGPWSCLFFLLESLLSSSLRPVAPPLPFLWSRRPPPPSPAALDPAAATPPPAC